MNFAHCRFCTALMVAGLLCLLATVAFAQDGAPASPNGTIPQPNRLQNAMFECGDGGYYTSQNSRNELILIPNHWTLAANGPIPILSSARIYFEGPKGDCSTRNKHVERIEGADSLFVSSLDIETPPEPGKPFDVSIYQQVDAIPGEPYSLSGWLLSLCGGSAVPSSCPTGYYMAKMLGIDPTGGVDPNASSVVWVENRNNFITPEGQRVGWSNLSVSAIAQSAKITIFARINSPFQWHGNHAFIDALDLVFAPGSQLTVTPTETVSRTYQLTWDGELGPDIAAIEGGNYKLYFDVQYFHAANNEWRVLQQGTIGAGSMPFTARCAGNYQFRVRTRAEQPEGGGGVSPNQRYPGVWSGPIQITVPEQDNPPTPVAGPEHLYLPVIIAQGTC